MRTELAAALLFGAIASPAISQQPTAPGTSQFPVKMHVAAGKPGADGEQHIVVTLTIEPAHYVYANPTGHEAMVGQEPVLTVTANNHPREAKVTYPTGELREDQIIGDFRVYTGTVTFVATVKRPKGEDKPLQVTVGVRPYNAAGCYWSTKSLTKVVPRRRQRAGVSYSCQPAGGGGALSKQKRPRKGAACVCPAAPPAVGAPRHSPVAGEAPGMSMDMFVT
jgi:hypothetical protein